MRRPSPANLARQPRAIVGSVEHLDGIAFLQFAQGEWAASRIHQPGRIVEHKGLGFSLPQHIDRMRLRRDRRDLPDKAKLAVRDSIGPDESSGAFIGSQPGSGQEEVY